MRQNYTALIITCIENHGDDVVETIQKQLQNMLSCRMAKTQIAMAITINF